MPSSSVIAKLERKREGINRNNVTSNCTGNTSNYTHLIKRMRGFLLYHSAVRGPATNGLLDAFSHVPDRVVAIFKRFLNTNARKKKERCVLNDDDLQDI
mmetsp:Transcript_20381/g.31163  ORF Transcript_20381/g.31163 Transcript_20381/m.31163 type:complete len:99 (-) Transcript_20381:9-305(-)